ncbi:hypothetical protein ACLB2K_024967 [Fragaria x ananassa]
MRTSLLHSNREITIWGFRVSEAKATSFGDMALDKVKELVSSNPVVIFRFSLFFFVSLCPYCVCVKQLFVLKLGIKYKAIELDQESDGSEIQFALAEWTGQQTLPNVFVGGNHIGDCDTTWDLHKEGKLVPVLTEAGVVAKLKKLEIS